MAADQPAANDAARSLHERQQPTDHLVGRVALAVAICLLVAVALGAGVGLLLSDALLTLVDSVSSGGS